jgi:hypothetical protein
MHLRFAMYLASQKMPVHGHNDFHSRILSLEHRERNHISKCNKPGQTLIPLFRWQRCSEEVTQCE